MAHTAFNTSLRAPRPQPGMRPPNLPKCVYPSQNRIRSPVGLNPLNSSGGKKNSTAALNGVGYERYNPVIPHIRMNATNQMPNAL